MQLVSISGPPSAGKTTLWDWLRSELGDRLRFVPDLPRQALEALGTGALEADPAAFQHYVGYAQLVAEESNRTRAVTVCDKSLIDALAYWNVLVDERSKPPWAEFGTAPRYELAVICERAPGMHAHGIQNLHETVEDALAERVREIAASHAVETVTVTGSTAERLTAVRDKLTAIGALPGGHAVTSTERTH